ncbi:hypothetical protein [Burkholderia mayonis]|uniref:Uncharacterized protein n=1 Tax=Burkholderia mayonis TaxID=1385591 RepID=A0A1B4FVB3_9BURK|nr:hypothetical protein [Burkholderia mayonis]AOJ07623.1 hypothetical protein WS71_10090 [Burkholderia mayonis]KVE58328.1 hypothetical protein WS71_24565 [Burkholderia mayonis]
MTPITQNEMGCASANNAAPTIHASAATARAPTHSATLAALTDEQRELIEREEERLRGRGPEDTTAANGLLEVLIAHPVRPVADGASAQPEKSRADALLYEHDDGRYAVASTAEDATFTRDDPAWHRLGPVTVHGGPAVAPADHISQAGKMVDAAAPIEEMIRFCPECGRLGDIPDGYEACCPDWSHARVVPKRFAELCAETFRLCVSQPYPKSTAAPADERAAFLTWWCDDVPENMREGWKEGVDECLRRGKATDKLAGAWDGFQFGVQYARAPASPATEGVSLDLLPSALWTRNGSGSSEWWSFKGYDARKDSADQWVLRKGGEELYRHTFLQVVMAHAERAILATSANETGAASDQTELASMMRMFLAACTDLGLINEALGLDPDDGGAEPILEAIAELKGRATSANETGAEGLEAIACRDDLNAGCSLYERLQALMPDWYSDAWEDMLLKYQRAYTEVATSCSRAMAAVAPAVPIELSSVAETLAEGSGFWRSCSGCHETNEGHETGHYPYSKILKCHLGGGCSECGGIGAVWDDTDYEAMGRAFEQLLAAPESASKAPASPAAEAVRIDVTYDDVVSVCDAHGITLPVEAIDAAVALINHFAAPQPVAETVATNGFFVYDAGCGHVEFYDTDFERDAAHRDAINEYRREAMRDQEWSMDVEGIVSGVVTHTTAELKVEDGGYEYEPRLAIPQPAQADAPADAREPITRESALAAIDEFELVCDNNIARDLSPDEKFAVSEFVISLLENAPVSAPADARQPHTYASTQATNCARCGEHKHTPLRIDWMGGYVCLTCVDRELESRVPADAGEAATIYQISFADEEGWNDTNKKVFDSHPAHARRIVYTAPPTARVGSLTAAARDVLDERRRQVETEWWTPEHDDQHTSACLAVAAACYGLFAAASSSDSADSWLQEWRAVAKNLWPFDEEWLKTTEPRRDLVKAGALIQAEIERLDRADLLKGADHA